LRKRWFGLVVPLLASVPLALATGPPPDRPAPEGAGPSDLLPPCEGVLHIKIKPLERGKKYSDVEAVSCEPRGAGQPDPGPPSWGGPPVDSAARGQDQAEVRTSFSRGRAAAKGRPGNGRGRGAYREKATGALIGQDFDLTGYRTMLVQWTGSSAGCTTGQSYAVPNVGSSLNDRIESSRSFSGCTRNYHYQNGSYTGALQPCGTACSTLGTLNNQTTSLRWSR